MFLQLATFITDDMVHIYGRYLTPSHMQMEVNHENRGQKTQDAHFSLQLDTDGMLGTRAYLRKEIKDDIQVGQLLQYQSEIDTSTNDVYVVTELHNSKLKF